jgi:hypothetical protein
MLTGCLCISAQRSAMLHDTGEQVQHAVQSFRSAAVNFLCCGCFVTGEQEQLAVQVLDLLS